MNRRRFMQLALGAGVATATMAEVGFMADFWAWIKNPRTWFIPAKPKLLHPLRTYDAVCHIIPADEYFPELSLKHLAAIYYDKRVGQKLKRNLVLDEVSLEKSLPVARRGRSLHLFDYESES